MGRTVAKLNPNDSNIYGLAETVDVSSGDWVPTHGPYARGLVITTGGNLKVDLYLGGDTITIPVVVDSSSHFELRGYAISKVYAGASGTTVSGITALL